MLLPEIPDHMIDEISRDASAFNSKENQLFLRLIGRRAWFPRINLHGL
jgi:hypothetical protein